MNNYISLIGLLDEKHVISSTVYFNTPMNIWMAGIYYNQKGNENENGLKVKIGSGDSTNSAIEAIDIAAKNLIEMIKI